MIRRVKGRALWKKLAENKKSMSLLLECKLFNGQGVRQLLLLMQPSSTCCARTRCCPTSERRDKSCLECVCSRYMG